MGRRAQQRQILALLLAIAALTLPVAGAVLYHDVFGPDPAQSAWLVLFMGAANQSDLLGPVLLAGAVGLGVLVVRGERGADAVPRSLLASLLVIAAVVQGAAFAVGAFDLATSDVYDIPSTGAWTAAQWSIVARFVIQAVVCATVIAFGMRWFAPDDRRASS
ncbi:MAG: hypothetical protein JWO77_660 [Ilumatobacteraceae bacterium]|nr:hypothetical protein [Ilumatobacteraceae bacterium]